MRNFNTLKIGDNVVVYDRYSTRVEPREYCITKIGKKYIHVGGNYNYSSKFNIENGYGEYGYSLFPGSLDEYKAHVSLKDYRIEITKKFNSIVNSLSKEELDNIMSILNKL
jgi:hypothetical protein